MRVRLVRSVWPSASGWFAVVMLWSIFKRAMNARQKQLTNLGALSIRMLLGNPWSFQT